MSKLDFGLCENKDADQLCSNCTADQRLCFHCSDSTISLLLKSKISRFYCGCTDQFVSDLGRNPEDQFSRVEAHIKCYVSNNSRNVLMVG